MRWVAFNSRENLRLNDWNESRSAYRKGLYGQALGQRLVLKCANPTPTRLLGVRQTSWFIQITKGSGTGGITAFGKHCCCLQLSTRIEGAQNATARTLPERDQILAGYFDLSRLAWLSGSPLLCWQPIPRHASRQRLSVEEAVLHSPSPYLSKSRHLRSNFDCFRFNSHRSDSSVIGR